MLRPAADGDVGRAYLRQDSRDGRGACADPARYAPINLARARTFSVSLFN